MPTIPILLAHDDFYVVHKPAGVTMHDSDKGIITVLAAQLAETDLYLCHRLDDGTSGCLIIARNAGAAATLSGLFARREIQKYYVALAPGKPKKKQGSIVGDMKNRRGGQHILLKSRDNPAATQFFCHSISPGLRAYLVRPLTGKTHQIRVALKSLGCPILGDQLYGGQNADRLYLHAWRVEFHYDGQPIAVHCLPASGSEFLTTVFSEWLARFSAPAALPWPDLKLSSNIQ